MIYFFRSLSARVDRDEGGDVLSSDGHGVR